MLPRVRKQAYLTLLLRSLKFNVQSLGQFCDYAAVDKDLSIIHGQKHVTFFMHIYRLCALCEVNKLTDVEESNGSSECAMLGKEALRRVLVSP